MPNDDLPTTDGLQEAVDAVGPDDTVGHDGTTSPDDPDGFAARTAAAEALDLPARADAFDALHDELRTRLESGGATSA